MSEPQRLDPHEQQRLIAGEIREDIRVRARLPEPITPERALQAVMCTLSQHVSGGEARDLRRSLPEPLRPLFDRCMLHREGAASRFDRAELLSRVAHHLNVLPGTAEQITIAVLGVVSSRLPPKEVADVASQLPHDLRELWSAAAPEAPRHPLFHDIERSVALPEGTTGAAAFCAVMSTLARRLTRTEAMRLADAFGPKLRAVLGPFVEHRAEDAESFDRDGFFARIANVLKVEAPEPIVRAVIPAVKEHLSEECATHLRSVLPRDLAKLWEHPERA